MIKKALILSLALGLSAQVHTEEYKVLFDTDAFPPPSYDENGYDSNGIHKDTGTAYNPSGYDINGFDSGGYGVEECHYDRYGSGYTYARRNKSTYVYDLFWYEVFEGSTQGYPPIRFNNYEYTIKGTVLNSDSNYTYNEICRKEFQ